ncbi:MAG TPA: hypothetical protein VMH22_03260 [bacterium]|nr:hypothetical protein [bacterium]
MRRAVTLQEHMELLLDEQRIGIREATSICEGQFAVAVAHFEVYLEGERGINAVENRGYCR